MVIPEFPHRLRRPLSISTLAGRESAGLVEPCQCSTRVERPELGGRGQIRLLESLYARNPPTP